MPPQEEPRGRAHPANDQLLYLVNRVARAMNRASDDIALEHGLTLPELMVLLVLGEDVGLSNAQLARRTFVTSQSAHQVVIGLGERGLIERLPHPINRRIRVTRLTDAGWEVLERARLKVGEVEQRALKRLDPQERRALRPALLHTAEALSGGWFGDAEAEAAATARRLGRSRG